MQVREVMSNRVLLLRHDNTVFEAAELLSKHNIGSVPVVSAGELCGILTDRDIVLRCVAGGDDAKITRVGAIMSTKPVTTTPDATVEEAMRTMAREQVRRLPVVEGARLVGMLSLADVARARSGQLLAETVTEISLI